MNTSRLILLTALSLTGPAFADGGKVGLAQVVDEDVPLGTRGASEDKTAQTASSQTGNADCDRRAAAQRDLDRLEPRTSFVLRGPPPTETTRALEAKLAAIKASMAAGQPDWNAVDAHLDQGWELLDQAQREAERELVQSIGNSHLRNAARLVAQNLNWQSAALERSGSAAGGETAQLPSVHRLRVERKKLDRLISEFGSLPNGADQLLRQMDTAFQAFYQAQWDTLRAHGQMVAELSPERRASFAQQRANDPALQAVPAGASVGRVDVKRVNLPEGSRVMGHRALAGPQQSPLPPSGRGPGMGPELSWVPSGRFQLELKVEWNGLTYYVHTEANLPDDPEGTAEVTLDWSQRTTRSTLRWPQSGGSPPSNGNGP